MQVKTSAGLFRRPENPFTFVPPRGAGPAKMAGPAFYGSKRPHAWGFRNSTRSIKHMWNARMTHANSLLTAVFR